MANLETRGKNYTSNRDLCVKDSCESKMLVEINFQCFAI